MPQAPLTQAAVAKATAAAVALPEGVSASLQARRPRSHSRPTILVVHSRLHAVRFRILSTHVPDKTELPVSLPRGHRMCQKAMDCNGDETSDRYQR
jgi:hypothetical protein